VAPTTEELHDACRWSRKQARCSSPKSCPATAWARQCLLPRHWWMRLIQSAPPNPNLLRDGTIPRLWWYDRIRAMQVEDARLASRAHK
jgi:hypothetical protein